MSQSAIIAIGYNNVKSLVRLLDSLNRADYGDNEVTLIISIDYSGKNDVEMAAKKFCWLHGEKELRIYDTRQGLRKHVLSCGEYFEKYEALYIFEDDVLAAESFYKYGEACIEFYAADKRIAGISLYSPTWNQNANFPFEPIRTGYDTYFGQFAPSWGQIWLKEAWQDFEVWYQNNLDFFEREENIYIPKILYQWKESSWLKYHIAYCVINNKYYVYPYYSYTTDFVEKGGTHFEQNLTRFQANLFYGKIEKYRFATLNNDSVCYDAFFENVQLLQKYKRKNMDVTIDLYGCKDIASDSGLALTTQNLSFAVVEEFAMQLRPLDLNVLMELDGTDIYLYDTSKRGEKRTKKRKNFYLKRWDYFMLDRFLMMNEIMPISFAKAANLVRQLTKGDKK